MEVLHYNLDMTPESEWKIVSAGAFARDNLLYLQEAGHFISGANYYTVRKDLDSYLVKLTLSGAGILEYGGETYRLPAGSFFWIDCRAPQHYYTAPDAGQWDVSLLRRDGGCVLSGVFSPDAGPGCGFAAGR